MNLEGLTLSCIRKELAPQLLGGRIVKVYQGEHSLCLYVKKGDATLYLTCDLGQGGPSLYLAPQPIANPAAPPAFCMLLRKHLEEARIIDLRQEGLERCLCLETASLGQGGRLYSQELLFELTGKNANIILCAEGRIKDCLRHIGPSQSSYRQLLPNLPYLPPPPQDGLAVDRARPEAVLDRMQGQLAVKGALAALIAATCGIGRATAGELLLRSSLDPKAASLTEAQAAALLAALAELQGLAASQQPSFYAVKSRDGRVKTLLLLSPQQLAPGEGWEVFSSGNQALVYAASLTPLAPPRQAELAGLVANELQRLSRKLQALKGDLAQANNAETERQLADTLLANLYQLPKGAASVTLANIYDGQPVTIALSPSLSGNANAQAYYKRYTKYKRAQLELAQQLAAARQRLSYLESVALSLDTATSGAEVAEIAAELQEAGLLQPPKAAKRRQPLQGAESQPHRFSLGPDCTIYVGKNNRQNDYVTFTLGGPRDLWFHTKDIPGSHVLLKCSLAQPPAEAVAAAVELAAYFSKARQGSQVPVDCTLRRYVKKPAGAPPGFVIFTNQTTYYVTPDEAKLKAKYGL